jgi:hypothetical protein
MRFGIRVQPRSHGEGKAAAAFRDRINRAGQGLAIVAFPAPFTYVFAVNDALGINTGEPTQFIVRGAGIALVELERTDSGWDVERIIYPLATPEPATLILSLLAGAVAVVRARARNQRGSNDGHA